MLVYGCVSLLVYVHAVCLCVCDIKSGYYQKPHHALELSKPGTLFHETHSKVLVLLRYQDTTFVDS